MLKNTNFDAHNSYRAWVWEQRLLTNAQVEVGVDTPDIDLAGITRHIRDLGLLTVSLLAVPDGVIQGGHSVIVDQRQIGTRLDQIDGHVELAVVNGANQRREAGLAIARVQTCVFESGEILKYNVELV